MSRRRIRGAIAVAVASGVLVASAAPSQGSSAAGPAPSVPSIGVVPSIGAVPSTGAVPSIGAVPSSPALPSIGSVRSAVRDPFAGALVSALTATAGTSRYLKSSFSGIVLNPADGSVLWQYNSGRARMPASTEKLLTAYTVLHSMDLDATLTTRVLRSQADPSVLYLRGGGDPSLTGARLVALAQQAAVQLQGPPDQPAPTLTLDVDRSFFPDPTPATGWKADYLKGDVQLVQGLTLAGYRKPDGALAAGTVFAAALSAAGVATTVRAVSTTPPDATELASSSSPPVRELLARMLAVSDNDYAEYLLRHAALARGAAPTWAGALANERRLLTRAGIPVKGLRVNDGSGLSRSNRMLPATLAAVVRLLWTTPQDAEVAFAWDAMPRAGQTGTLARRYLDDAHVCALGQVLAKTGSLTDAAGLAGVARGVDGQDRVFVFLDDGLRGKYVPVSAALDTLATSVVGCRLALQS